MGVVCFRPSAVLGRPGLKKYADEADKAIAEECKALGLPRAFGLPVEEIAQVSMTVSIKTDKEAKGPQTALMFGTPAMVRATKDFDWAAEIKALLPGVKEVRHGDRVSISCRRTGRSSRSLLAGRCAATSRTAGPSCSIRRSTWPGDRRQARRRPRLGRRFQSRRAGTAAVVLDNRNGAWARELSAQTSRSRPAPFQDHTSWVVVGLTPTTVLCAMPPPILTGKKQPKRRRKLSAGASPPPATCWPRRRRSLPR